MWLTNCKNLNMGKRPKYRRNRHYLTINESYQLVNRTDTRAEAFPPQRRHAPTATVRNFRHQSKALEPVQRRVSGRRLEGDSPRVRVSIARLDQRPQIQLRQSLISRLRILVPPCLCPCARFGGRAGLFGRTLSRGRTAFGGISRRSRSFPAR
jgi:uncharacterized protein (DUF2342 family)